MRNRRKLLIGAGVIVLFFSIVVEKIEFTEKTLSIIVNMIYSDEFPID